MKIEMKYFNRIAYPLLAVSFAYNIYDVVTDSQKYKDTTDLKQEILQKDRKRYDSLMNDGIHRYSFADWQYEVNKVNDSLKADSMIKRAYFEGAQMVRDSLEKGNK